MNVPDVWCVYEHHMMFEAGQPPTLIYVATCKLIDVYQMREARNNSDWCQLAAIGYPLIVRIIKTTADRREAFNFTVKHVKSFTTMPRCNLHGYNLFAAKRTIVGDDAREYASQAAAARALGCSQSAVSQHLNGNLDSIKGHKLTYKNGRL
jgi:hypothetical protein